MKNLQNDEQQVRGLTLVIGGTGKTGARVVQRLQDQGFPTRIASRSASPAFDWNLESTWDAALADVSSVYLTYAPDLAIPGATDSIEAFIEAARSNGAEQIVLLSGRGEDEAQACESILMNSGLRWTVVRASWFNQNFSEGAFVDMVKAGQLTLPAGAAMEPFVDVDDIADVAAAALTGPGHDGEVYEVTGPRLLTFADIAKMLSEATGRSISYTEIPHDAFVSAVAQSGAPEEIVWIMDYLFSTVLDGRNAYLTDGVERALGRKPKDFAAYARDVARNGIWRAAA